MADTNDILREYDAKLNQHIQNFDSGGVDYSREYFIFKQEMAPEFTRYERWCKSLGSMIKINFSKKEEDVVRRSLQIAHLDVEPWQALGLGLVIFLFVFMFSLLISFSVVLLGFASFPVLFFILMLVLGVFLFYFMNGYPQRLANKWRLKASSQMVPAILYMVVYMRHTPNIEKAVGFASQHLDYPLALDFKKVFYDVSIGKFSTMKDSLDNYLETWRDYSIEFIEAFHLIESSLFEQDNARRIATLEKSLQVVLDGVYDKMLKFTHEVRSPLTNVYMLGVVLPTLGLAILPLASAMLGGAIKWYHVIILFNLIIPFFVFYLTDKVMMMRPGGHGNTKLLEKSPLYPVYQDKSPYFLAFIVCLPFFILGFLPLIFQFTPVPEFLGFQKDYTFNQIGLGILGNEKIFDFQNDPDTGKVVGPFGFGALFFGLFFPLGLALFFAIAYGRRTHLLIKEREDTKQLEEEFTNSLFQLGNRIGNGLPPERAFGNVAESSKGLMTENFFRSVNYNVVNMGMDVESAIFDPRRGVLNNYPSDLIATSMRVLIESSKKGLHIAAVSLMSISEYIKNLGKITNRLKDMLAEIVSDMKSNMTFLAPLLSGIVIGLSLMIVAIINKLDLSSFGGELGFAGGIGNLLQVFQLTKMIPPYYLQIAIGIYLIQIIFILTSTLVTINSGEDKLERINRTGKNLRAGIGLYFVTALLASSAMFFLAAVVLSGLGG